MEALDPITIGLAVSGTVTAFVAIVKMAGIATTPPRTIATVVAGAAVFTALYAVSYELITLRNAFGLGAGVVLTAAAAVGLHELNARK